MSIKLKYLLITTLFLTLLLSGCQNSIKAQIESFNYEYSVDGFLKSIQRQNYKLVDLYLEAGFLSRLDKSVCPLTLAIEAKSHTITKKFIKYGADVNSPSYPLATAVANGNLKIVEILVENGANYLTNIKPLALAAESNKIKIAEYLLKKGANPNLKNEPMVIEIAAQKGYLDLVELLIEHKAKINEIADPLHYAIKNNKLETVNLLLSEGAILNNTAEVLGEAILNKNIELIRIITAYGFNPKIGLDNIPLSLLYDFDYYIGSSENINNHNITLYFTGEDGLWQDIEIRRVPKVAYHLLADQLIEELFKGAYKKSVYTSIPKDTKLLPYNDESPKIKIVDGCAFVNLSSEFVDNHSGGSFGELMTIYSVVNTLTELEHIDKVQLLVNSEIHESLAGHFSMNEPLERDESYINPELLTN